MKITTLFLDLGGVVLTNGWGRDLRKKIIEKYGLDEKEFTERHNLIFGIFEIGKLSFEEYLTEVVFYKERAFTLEQMREDIYYSATEHSEMIHFICEMKKKFGWKIVAVTNEGKGLIDDRVQRFDLKRFIDFFVISAYVGLRKPDLDIYRLALSLSQSKPEEVLYIDDRPLLIKQAQSLGLHGICHRTVAETRQEIDAIIR